MYDNSETLKLKKRSRSELEKCTELYRTVQKILNTHKW